MNTPQLLIIKLIHSSRDFNNGRYYSKNCSKNFCGILQKNFIKYSWGTTRKKCSAISFDLPYSWEYVFFRIKIKGPLIDADKKYWSIDFYSMELEDTRTCRERSRMIRLNQIRVENWRKTSGGTFIFSENTQC